MKKIILLVFGLTTYFSVSAQNEKHPATIGVNLGFSAVGSLFQVADYGTGTSASSYATPAFQATYDYALVNWFSLGAGVSFQSMGISYDDYTYDDENGETRTASFKTKVNRFNLGIRPLFHYGNLNRIDMYSGLRVGFTNWNVSTNSPDPDFDETEDLDFNFNGVNVSAQLILFGLRGYFTDNLGANMELAVGSPHFFSCGLNYRW